MNRINHRSSYQSRSGPERPRCDSTSTTMAGQPVVETEGVADAGYRGGGG